MHDESVPYYDFKTGKTNTEIIAYNKLKELGVRIPNLLSYDFERHFFINEYIEGATAAENIASNKINENIIRQLFKMSRTLQSAKLNIDYFPTNFVISSETLYYIDYEINPYTDEWNLENWGLYYWPNSTGFKEFLETGNAFAINSDLDKGIPIKQPFEKTVERWKAEFSL